MNHLGIGAPQQQQQRSPSDAVEFDNHNSLGYNNNNNSSNNSSTTTNNNNNAASLVLQLRQEAEVSMLQARVHSLAAQLEAALKENSNRRRYSSSSTTTTTNGQLPHATATTMTTTAATAATTKRKKRQRQLPLTAHALNVDHMHHRNAAGRPYTTTTSYGLSHHHHGGGTGAGGPVAATLQPPLLLSAQRERLGRNASIATRNALDQLERQQQQEHQQQYGPIPLDDNSDNSRQGGSRRSTIDSGDGMTRISSSLWSTTTTTSTSASLLPPPPLPPCIPAIPPQPSVGQRRTRSGHGRGSSSGSNTTTTTATNNNNNNNNLLPPPIQRILDMFQRPSDHLDYLNSQQFAKDLYKVTLRVRNIVEQNEPRVLFLQSPTYVFGDIHGNLEDLHFFSDNIWRLGLSLTAGNFLFLGDYVDRGYQCLECLAYLFALKVQYPTKIYLLRGNHETRDVNGWEEHYGSRSFLYQCRFRFGTNVGYKVWEICNQAFDRMPLAAVIDQDIFCVHGGIPRPIPTSSIVNNDDDDDDNGRMLFDQTPMTMRRRSMTTTRTQPTTTRIQDILTVPKVAGINPPYEHEDEVYQQVASDCIWSDPASEEQERTTVDPITGFGESLRGGGAICFGHTAVTQFLEQVECSYIIRAHEAHADGVAISKGARVFTVFSTSQDHHQGPHAKAGCMLIDCDQLQVINRSPAYQNQYVHRRDSVSLLHVSDVELQQRIRLGLVKDVDPTTTTTSSSSRHNFHHSEPLQQDLHFQNNDNHHTLSVAEDNVYTDTNNDNNDVYNDTNNDDDDDNDEDDDDEVGIEQPPPPPPVAETWRDLEDSSDNEEEENVNDANGDDDDDDDDGIPNRQEDDDDDTTHTMATTTTTKMATTAAASAALRRESSTTNFLTMEGGRRCGLGREDSGGDYVFDTRRRSSVDLATLNLPSSSSSSPSGESQNMETTTTATTMSSPPQAIPMMNLYGSGGGLGSGSAGAWLGGPWGPQQQQPQHLPGSTSNPFLAALGGHNLTPSPALGITTTTAKNAATVTSSSSTAAVAPKNPFEWAKSSASNGLGTTMIMSGGSSSPSSGIGSTVTTPSPPFFFTSGTAPSKATSSISSNTRDTMMMTLPPQELQPQYPVQPSSTITSLSGRRPSSSYSTTTLPSFATIDENNAIDSAHQRTSSSRYKLHHSINSSTNGLTNGKTTTTRGTGSSTEEDDDIDDDPNENHNDEEIDTVVDGTGEKGGDDDDNDGGSYCSSDDIME